MCYIGDGDGFQFTMVLLLLSLVAVVCTDVPRRKWSQVDVASVYSLAAFLIFMQSSAVKVVLLLWVFCTFTLAAAEGCLGRQLVQVVQNTSFVWNYIAWRPAACARPNRSAVHESFQGWSLVSFSG